jgi:putative OmpL-like beta-barrel porin-2
MKVACRVLVAIFGLAVGVGSVPLCAAQGQTDTVQEASASMSQRMQELEKEVGELRGELAALKSGGGAPAGTPAPAMAVLPQSNAVSTTPATVNSPPGASLSSLLGPTSLSGFVDMYYNYNANQPASRTNSFRSFDAASNQFALNLVELVVDKTPEVTNSRTGYHIALGFGQAMNAVNGSDPGGLGFAQYLKEAYFSYLAPVGKGLQIDAGKFVTPHGAEVIETKDDLNYSRGLLFSYAIPYFHYGLRAKYTFNDKYSISGFMVNGWNNVVDNNTGKTYGIGFGWNPTKKISFTQNYMAGPEQVNNNSSWRQLWDTVVTYAPTSRLSFTLNTDYGRGDRMPNVAQPVFWTGAAGYVKYAFNEKYSLVTRYEYYNDHDGFTTGTPQHFNGLTTTFQRTIANHIMSRLEFRRDMSNEPTFLKGAGLPVTAQNTVTAGVVFMFDSREAK